MHASEGVYLLLTQASVQVASVEFKLDALFEELWHFFSGAAPFESCPALVPFSASLKLIFRRLCSFEPSSALFCLPISLARRSLARVCANFDFSRISGPFQ